MTHGSPDGAEARFRRYATIAAITALLGGLVSLTGVGSADAAGSSYSASFIAAGTRPFAVATDPVTDTVYVTSPTGHELSVINGATRTVTATISLGTAASEPVGAVPVGVAVDSATDTIYVTEQAGTNSNVVVIDGATNAVTTTIKLPADTPFGVAADSTTGTVYVAEEDAELAVIDTATNAVTGTISTGAGTRPVELAVDESSNMIWVANQAGTVVAVNGATDASTSIDLGSSEPTSVAVDPTTDTVYAADFKNGDVAVIDGAKDTLTTTIAAARVYGVAVDPMTDTVYADSYAAPFGTTWVIDGSSNKVADTLSRGGTIVAVDPSTGTAFEAANHPSAVGAWVITPATTNSWSPIPTGSTSAAFNTGQSGSFTITADGLPAPTFAETGTLPTGLTLNPDGTLSGTPAADAGGLYPITVTASNGTAPDATETFDLVVDQPTVITSPDKATFQVGTASRITLTSTGYPGPAAFDEIGILPTDLNVVDTTSGWILGGDPPVASGGVYPITIEAIDGSVVATQPFTLTINEAPSFISVGQATFRAGSVSRFMVSAHGFPKPTFTISGKLPAGVTLNSGHFLVGTPPSNSGGIYHATITATNAIASAKQAFTLTVHQVPAITSGRHATFRVGRHHSFTITSTGFPAARLSERGHLPKGVRFEVRPGGRAILTGAPARTDKRKTYVITIIAGNGIGPSVHETFSLKVS